MIAGHTEVASWLPKAEVSTCGNVLGSNSHSAGPKHRTVHKYGTYVPLGGR